MLYHRRCCKWLPPASIHSCPRWIMLRYTGCNIVILMDATAWLMLSFSSCIVWGFDSYTVLFKCPQPSQSLCYIRYTTTWWQHDCSLTVQTLCAIYILTPQRISQGHVHNGRWATFSWPNLYIRQMLYIQHTVKNLAVFTQYSVCFICSTCYITTSVVCVFNQYIKVSFKQWLKKVNVVPRITIVILCPVALACGDVISFLCRVCKYIICLAPTVIVVFPSKVYYILHDVQRNWHEDSTMTTGGSCIAIHIDTQAETCKRPKNGLKLWLTACVVCWLHYQSTVYNICVRRRVRETARTRTGSWLLTFKLRKKLKMTTIINVLLKLCSKNKQQD